MKTRQLILTTILILCASTSWAMRPGFWGAITSGGGGSVGDTVNISAFLGADGTSFTTSNPSWTSHLSYLGTAEIRSSEVMGTSTESLFYHSASPTSLQVIEIGINVRSTISNGIAFAGRIDTTSNSMIKVKVAAGRYISLYKIINGTITQVGSTYDAGVPDVSIIPAILTISGTSPNISATVKYNGVDVITSSTITGAELNGPGKTGIGFHNGGNSFGFVTGQHIKTFRVN